MSQDYIFQLEIPMHDLLRVKMLHTFHYLSDDNCSAFLSKCAFPLYQIQEVSVRS